MKKFKTKIEGATQDIEYDFVCYENDHPIEIGDKYIFFFAGIAGVDTCDSESIKSEVNPHDRPYKTDCIDLVHNFWRNCYKIKSTNFDFNQ